MFQLWRESTHTRSVPLPMEEEEAREEEGGGMVAVAKVWVEDDWWPCPPHHPKFPIKISK